MRRFDRGWNSTLAVACARRAASCAGSEKPCRLFVSGPFSVAKRPETK
jgi:hypothetical protein